MVKREDESVRKRTKFSLKVNKINYHRPALPSTPLEALIHSLHTYLYPFLRLLSLTLRRFRIDYK